jgi:hypothetical protein
MSSNLYAQALVSVFYGLIEFWEGDNLQVTSASTSQSKHFLVTNFSCLVNRPAKFLVEMPVQSSAALTALHDSPVALGLERMLCMRGINRESPQNSGSIVRRVSGSCPNRSSLECMTGLVA